MATTSGFTFPMTPKVKAFSFLNRWFIFRRRSTGSGGLPALSPSVVANVPLPVALAEPKAVAEEGPAEATEAAEAEEAAEEASAEEASAEAAVAEEAEAEAVKEEAPLPLADGPAYQFYHKSGAKDEIKLGDKHWRRYISTVTPFAFKDTTNPAIVYPSMEAAIGAAKYFHATNTPELGAQIFSLTGNIHQKYEVKKIGKSADEVVGLVEEEGADMRDAQKAAAFRKTASKFNQEAWNAVKERVLSNLVRQRYEGDAHFREILNALAAQKVRLVYFTVGGATELSGSLKSDGKIEGENLLGRVYMKQVGLRVA